MNAIELKKIFPDFDYRGNANVSFSSIEIDSRRVSKNSMFVAIQGTQFDSHTKISEAIKKGASVVVFEKDVKIPKHVLGIKVHSSRKAYALFSSAFFGFPSKKMKVVGITGTSGKTTTAFWMYHFFKDFLNKKSGFIGTIGEDRGNGFAMQEKFPPTTPDAFYLNKALYDMVQNGVGYAFIEVSSSAIYFARIEGITFYAKVLTNIAEDHLDVHKTFENYLDTKVSFFKGNTFSILNRDALYFEKFASVSRGFFTYGVKNKADITAKILSTGLSHTDFELKLNNRKILLRLNAGGAFNVYNFLAVASFGLHEGANPDVITKFARQIPAVPGRVRALKVRSGTIIIDFAHNPYEIAEVLKFLSKVKKNKLIVVVGAVGWSTKKKRKEIGETASQYGDTIIVTTDDPRGDDPDELISDVARFVRSPVVIKSRFDAIRRAVSVMSEGDIVAILGRGEEREIHFKDKTVCKSDEEIVREIINETYTG